MKRFICFVLIIAITCALCFALTGCNRQIIDSTWSFERAIIFLPDGEKIEGEVCSWKDYSESDMIQVAIDNKMYLTHSSNIILISE
jgi:hypothetical protein